jgi:hypothetical protein
MSAAGAFDPNAGGSSLASNGSEDSSRQRQQQLGLYGSRRKCFWIRKKGQLG